MDTQRSFNVLVEGQGSRDSLEVGGSEYGTSLGEAAVFISYKINPEEETAE